PSVLQDVSFWQSEAGPEQQPLNSVFKQVLQSALSVPPSPHAPRSAQKPTSGKLVKASKQVTLPPPQSFVLVRQKGKQVIPLPMSAQTPRNAPESSPQSVPSCVVAAQAAPSAAGSTSVLPASQTPSGRHL